MTRFLTSALLVAGVASVSAGFAAEFPAGDRAAIETVLSRYESALNQADVESVLSLYAEDGVFMPQHSLPSVGKDAVRSAYEGVFNAISLEIAFTVDEVVQLAPTWAFARTRSEGFVSVHANGERAPEANQELFLLHKSPAGEWQIARYIFSTTNPPRQ
ncbi:MAG: SgcJ/EcaC family oxidoreductase [Lysobacterales bacterium]|nr:SgcJ/EcaC family oxidoreductase [Xanthomonadales bacterium]MCP5477005.1 SgcJ/EcaC family oxidoreductase [Rhodanobacteraceae bacterium]